MDIKPWKFTDDQFDIETGDKVKNAILMSNFHDRNLRMLSLHNPALLPFYILYHFVHLALITGLTFTLQLL